MVVKGPSQRMRSSHFLTEKMLFLNRSQQIAQKVHLCRMLQKRSYSPWPGTCRICLMTPFGWQNEKTSSKKSVPQIFCNFAKDITGSTTKKRDLFWLILVGAHLGLGLNASDSTLKFVPMCQVVNHNLP